MTPGGAANRGCFITLEGGEGTGKTTQARRLAENLRDRGLAVVAVREPGGTPGAEEIRRLLVSGGVERWDPMCEALLLFAARRDLVERIIRPALLQGRWVVCDRFADSTMAYQGHGHGLGRQPVETLHRLAVPDLVPDLTVILDLPVEEGLRRARQRRGDEDRFERLTPAFHERLRAGFREIAQRAPERCAIVDAVGPVEAVGARVQDVVERRLGLP